MLQPYKSVQFEFNNSLLTISAPFLYAEISVDEKNSKTVRDMVNQLPRFLEGNRFQTLLSSFSTLPILWQRPRSKLFLSKRQDQSQDLFKKLSQTSTPSDFVKLLSDKIKFSFAAFSWQWNHEDILKKSALSVEGYDPISVYHLIREVRLLEEAQATERRGTSKSIEKFENRGEAEMFMFIALALRQTLFITKQCLNSIEPALTRVPESKDIIAKFLYDEWGHDQLIQLSLDRLGFPEAADIFPVLPSTSASMDLLREASQIPLGFTCAVEAFEGNVFAEADPLAERLRKSSRPDAAMGVEKHFYINKSHGHGNIGFDMVSPMGAVSREEVISAVRITELVTRLGESLNEELENYFL